MKDKTEEAELKTDIIIGADNEENKLEIFDYISYAIDVLEKSRDNYNVGAVQICNYLENALQNSDEVVGVTYRIKTASSLKEKIVRNNLYKKFTAQELVPACSDIIGVRIECRFLEDEKTVYEKIKKIFNYECGGGSFCPVNKRNLFLKMGYPQPEIQKNGHEIYRIDGFIEHGGGVYNFELQLKSLVNSFWSEIEHKIIYKNKRFMMIDSFVNELMNSINDNLRNIDSQLNMLFKRCLGNSLTIQKSAVQTMLVTMINDLYSNLVEKKVGISINIKPYSESLVNYILGYSSFKEENPVSDAFHNGTVLNLFDWLRSVDFSLIPIGSKIAFSKQFDYKSELIRTIGEKLLSNINSDFYCNTFFHILFSVEVGNDAQDFMNYVIYYERRICGGKSPEAEVRLKYEIEKADAGKLLLESEIMRLEQIV